NSRLVAVGGGGLIGGIAAWYREPEGGRRARRHSDRSAGDVKVIGVEPEAAPTLTEALKAGRPVDAKAGGLAADSLAPRRVGELVFPIAQRYVDHVVLVSDDDIRRAQELLWSALRVVAA